MKTLKSFPLACLLGVFMASSVFADGLPKAEKWVRFSKGLVEAIHSDNQGLRMSALQQIAQYGENLEIDNHLVFDIVRIYRNSKEQHCRLLALAALHSIQNEWAMDFLKRSVRFEKDDHVKHLTCTCVNEYYGET